MAKLEIDITEIHDAVEDFNDAWPGWHRVPRHLRERFDAMLNDPDGIAVMDNGIARASPELNAIIANLRALR